MINVLKTKLLDEAEAVVNKFLSPTTRLTCFDTMSIRCECDENMYKYIKKYKISKESHKK